MSMLARCDACGTEAPLVWSTSFIGGPRVPGDWISVKDRHACPSCAGSLFPDKDPPDNTVKQGPYR